MTNILSRQVLAIHGCLNDAEEIPVQKQYIIDTRYDDDTENETESEVD